MRARLVAMPRHTRIKNAAPVRAREARSATVVVCGWPAAGARQEGRRGVLNARHRHATHQHAFACFYWKKSYGIKFGNGQRGVGLGLRLGFGLRNPCLLFRIQRGVTGILREGRFQRTRPCRCAGARRWERFRGRGGRPWPHGKRSVLGPGLRFKTVNICTIPHLWGRNYSARRG